MSWQGQTTIDNSTSRIRDIDRDRRLAPRRTGYVEPNIQDMVLGEAREFQLAVMHVDINGFKQIAVNLSNVQYMRLVSIFLTEMTQLVKDFNGMIDRYVGDQVTALFGIGVEAELACRRCLNCALTMQTIVKYVMKSYLQSVSLPSFTCSIGMDFGDIWYTRVGIHGENQFTLIGNTVSLAAQLVDIAGDGWILLGQDVYDHLSSTEKAYCREYTHPQWNWTFTQNGQRHKYRFFRYTAYWQGFPL